MSNVYPTTVTIGRSLAQQIRVLMLLACAPGSGASLQSFSAAPVRVSRRTHAWVRLRAAALQRDGYICAVPGWGNATHVDHVVSLDNLRSLCAMHDGQINEDNSGKSKSDSKPYLQNQNMF